MYERDACTRGDLVDYVNASSKILSDIEKLQVFLKNVTDDTTIAQLEEKGIKAFFRGTTKNIEGVPYPGSPNTIEHSLPTSTDPIVSEPDSVDLQSVPSKDIDKVRKNKDYKNK